MYCRAQLGELTREYETLRALDAEVVAISTDNLVGAETIVRGLGVPFPILYNPDAEVVEEYGVFNLLGDGLATTSTFVIDKEGVIRWKHVGRGISDRASTTEVIAQLEGL